MNWAEIILALATLLTAFGAFLQSLRNNRQITQINHAVNGKIAGAQSMQSQVDDLHRYMPDHAADAEAEAEADALLPLVREMAKVILKEKRR